MNSPTYEYQHPTSVTSTRRVYLLTFIETKESPKRSIKLNNRYFLLSGSPAAQAVPSNDRRKFALARHTRPAEET